MPGGRPAKSFQEVGYVIEASAQYQAVFHLAGQQRKLLRGPYRDSHEAAMEDVLTVRTAGREL